MKQKLFHPVGLKGGLIFPLLLCCVTLMAQNAMKVHYKDGGVLDISIEEIDSVTFVEKATLA